MDSEYRNMLRSFDVADTKWKRLLHFYEDITEDSEMGPLARIITILAVPVIVLIPSFLDVFNVVDDLTAWWSIALNEIGVTALSWMIIFVAAAILFGISGLIGWVVRWVVSGDTDEIEWDDWLAASITAVFGIPWFLFCFLFCKSRARTEFFKSADQKAKDKLVEG